MRINCFSLLFLGTIIKNTWYKKRGNMKYIFLIVFVLGLCNLHAGWGGYSGFSSMNQSKYRFQYPAEIEGFSLLEGDFTTFMDDVMMNNGSEVLAQQKAQEFIISGLQSKIIAALEQGINTHENFNTISDPVIKYIMKYRFSFLHAYLPTILNQLIISTEDEQEGAYTTLLHLAARNNEEKFVKFLIECGANINILDSNGATALHDAAMNNAAKAVKVLLDAHKIVKNQKIKLTIQDTYFGRTPLHYAVEFNYKDVVSLLLAAGANGVIPDKEGKKAIDLVGADENYYFSDQDNDAMYALLKKYKIVKRQ